MKKVEIEECNKSLYFECDFCDNKAYVQVKKQAKNNDLSSISWYCKECYDCIKKEMIEFNNESKLEKGIANFAEGISDIINSNKTIAVTKCAVCDTQMNKEYKYCHGCGREIVRL